MRVQILDGRYTSLCLTDKKYLGAYQSNYIYNYIMTINNDEIENVLTVVIAADKNFSVPLGMAVLSLLETAASTTKYDIYVLDDSVDNEIKQQIDGFAGLYHFNITYIDVSEIIDNVPSSIYFPRVAFARFLIPQLLPHKEKVLYSDADVLFREDLAPLFNTDMESMVVAACPDINMARKSQRHYFNLLEEEYGICFYQDSNLYFHSGFLLFNCELWTAGNFTEKIFKLAQSNFSSKIQYYDQDFMNIACFGNIKRVSSRYCSVPQFETHYYSDFDINYNDIENFESSDNLRNAYEKPAIIHYAGLKPIVFRKPIFKNEEPFFEFWRKSPWHNRLPYLPREILTLKRSIDCSSGGNPSSALPVFEKLVTVTLFTDNIVRNKAADKFIKTLTSLCKLQTSLFEILVIDNESSDGTRDLLNKCKELGALRYIAVKCTMYEACGHILKEASGKYIHLVELGDVVSDKNIYKNAFMHNESDSVPHLLRREILLSVLKSISTKTEHEQQRDILLVIKMLKTAFITGESFYKNRYQITDVLSVFYRKLQIQYLKLRLIKQFTIGEGRRRKIEQIENLKSLLDYARSIIH